MKAYLRILLLCSLGCGAIHAATVVTAKERIEGTIVAKDKTSVTLRMEDGHERQIQRDRIVQIFDDSGKIVYTSPALMPAPRQDAVAAEQSTAESGFHIHDGLYLRFLLGAGSLNFSESPVFTNNTGTITASGPAGFFAFHLGFALTENVILYGSMNGYSASNPDYALNGTSLKTTTSNSLGFSSYGAGLAVYLESINAYLSGDIGTTTTRLTVGNTNTSSKAGLGINMQLGKEWWVSKNWGLGAALFYHYSSMDDDVSGSIVPKITNSVVGLAFSATFN